MASRMVGQFMKALCSAEERHDPEPLLGLFGEDASFWSPRRETHGGSDACRRFWSDYLVAFRDVHSDFKGVREGDGFAVLEWESNGHLADGAPIRYTGVTIIEGDGEKLSRFRTYFDTAPFERLARH
jgi:ketosteroid isomerase-like protein